MADSQTQIFACHQCNREVDERSLYTVIRTTEYCPYCRSTILRHTEDRQDKQWLASVTAAEDVPAIDAWLERYAADTGRQIVKRESVRDGGASRQSGTFLWSIETPYGIAIECCYDERRPQTAEIRTVTTQHGQEVFERFAEVSRAAAGQGFQVHGRRLQSSSIGVEIEVESQAVWGLLQVVDLGELSTELLAGVAKRLAKATRVVVARISESRN